MSRMAQWSRGSRHRQIWPVVNLADHAGQTPIGAINVMALTVRLALVSAGQWGSQAAKVHKLGAYDGVIRLARAHLGLFPSQSQYAVAKALLLLRPGDYRRHRPKWCVPGDGVAGKDAEQRSDMDGREGEKKRLLRKRVSALGHVLCQMRRRVEEVSRFDGRFEDESQFDAPVDGTDDEPFIDEGPAPEIIQPTEGGGGPSTQLCVEVDARREIIRCVRVVSRPASPDAPGCLYRKGKTSAVGAMERKATTHVGSWLSLSCVPSRTVGTSGFRAEAMGNENSAPPAAGAWPDLQHKKRNATAELEGPPRG
ncbi:hypothetical protein QYE76_019897 [Lolium multiflorum]|uniref:Uncharacterized protein n=1 Tax=Lolium multiflorum TaxID=4521 RepID=A0AAD8R5B1_LOLMU|nr:hypothetical protein QYE76_019897 [Lolium multiflorum]